MDTNLFYTVMEAEGDMLEPFDPNAEPPMDEMTDQQQGQTEEQPPADMGADSPPEATDMEDLSFDETGGDMEESNEGDQSSGDADEQKTKSLSQKANDVLNQRLYQQMLNRNSEIEETIENLQVIIPLLPYDVVTQNDNSINRLKRALTNGQEYVLNKFVNMSYGENLLYYQKLDSLYTLLQDAINSVFNKFQKDSE